MKLSKGQGVLDSSRGLPGGEVAVSRSELGRWRVGRKVPDGAADGRLRAPWGGQEHVPTVGVTPGGRPLQQGGPARSLSQQARSP